MKIISKKTLQALTVTVAMSSFSGGAVRAVDLPSSINTRNVDIKQQLSDKTREVCSRFTSSRLSGKVNDKKAELEKKLEEHKNSLDSKRSEWDSRRAEERQSADQSRIEHYERLMAAAATDEQKAAVVEFKTAVESAVAARRAAQDAAREEYRKGVDAAIAEKKNNISGASSALQSDIDAAIAKASLACENGTPIEEVMKTLKADLESAREAYKNDARPENSIADTIKALNDTRLAAFEKAVADFKAEMDEARTDLKSALGQ